MAVSDYNTGGINVVVCTAAADTYTPANDRRIALVGIRWCGVAAAVTDRLVIQNAASQTIFEAYAGAAVGSGYTVESKIFQEMMYLSTFTVQTMSSGTVYLYYK